MNNLIIKNKKPIQENFLGFNAVYHGFAGMKDKDGRDFSEELCDLEADRAADLGVKVARTRYQWIAYDWEKGIWDWENSPEFNAFCRWAERMKKRGIDVALNALWSNMVDIMGTGWGGKSPLAVGDNWKKSVENYAWWVSETVHQMVEIRGLTNVKYLVMFTEPQNLNGRQVPKGAINHFEAWYYATKAVSDRLKKDGRRHLVKLIGPNEGSVFYADMTKWLIDKDPNLIDIYSAHAYLTEVRDTSKARMEGENFLCADRGGIRIFQKVDLKPNTKYEFSFYAKLDMENPENASGYLLAGAFSLKELDFITSGGSPTNRLGRYTTKMFEGARIENEWQQLTVEFETPDDASNAAIGVFNDINQNSGKYKLYFSNPSLKEKGNNTELLKNTKLQNTMEDWGVRVPEYKYIFDNQYDYWMFLCENYKSVTGENAFWIDEYNTLGNRPDDFDATTVGLNNYDSPGYGTDLALARVAFLNAGIQSSMQWTIFDQLWPDSHSNGRDHWVDGVHSCGIMPCLLRSTTPKPAYFAVRVAGLLGGSEGTKAYAGEGNKKVRLGMTKNPNGEVAVLVVNESKESQEFEIVFEEDLNADLNRYSYDPATVTVNEVVSPIESDKLFEQVTNKIKDTIPSGGVYTYTNKRV